MISTKCHHDDVSTGENSKVAATPTTGAISKKNKTNNNKFKDDGKSHVWLLSEPKMNIRVKELLGLAAGNGQCFIATRVNVIEAEQLCKEAKRIARIG